ncbi:hypothetical protein V3C99_012672 [Haemonchus contortus]
MSNGSGTGTMSNGYASSVKGMGNVRDAKEIFIYMHRNFRVSRNIRAHWLFDHLNKTVRIEESPGEGEYSNEMSVVGIIPMNGEPDDCVVGEDFRVCLDTKITYISRYYRHVFVLDLSPSTIVADEESNCCLHTKLLECLRLSMASVSKKFTIPGTRRTFSPQIYVSVCVFIPFLAFEQDLVLVQGILLTESNINSVLHTVTQKFNDLLNSLYVYSKGILQKWGTLRRRHRNKYDSACGDIECIGEYETTRTSSLCNDGSPNKVVNNVPMKPAPIHPRSIMDYVKGVWTVSAAEDENTTRNPLCDGYIHPEWALIFMLRLGLIAVQMMHENTQSNIIVITDAVCGMPDANALQQLLSQLRSYTVSCSFIQLQGRSRNEACFGHVASCELFHFLAMATFGVYIPNCRCAIGVDMNDIHEPLVYSEDEEEVDEDEYKPLNPFHRALLCWCFQNALQDNVHITNLVNEINPEFAQLYKNDVVRHRYIRSVYRSALHEILYIRLREGFTLKQVRLCNNDTRIMIVLSMPFRPLVFIDYTIIANWPSDKMSREDVTIDLVIQAPYNELKDLLSEGQFPNAVRQKLVKSLRNLIDDILEADRVLLHIHAFNSDPVFYTIPLGVSTKIPIFTLEDKAKEMSIFLGTEQENANTFVGFWSSLCQLNEKSWQKWVHMHAERVVLKSSNLPFNMFGLKSDVKIDCRTAEDKLHDLLREQSSFCLVQRQTYVTFVYGKDSNVPVYFYMVKVTLEAPCLILRTAFLGGISSIERRSVVDAFRRKLLDLRIVADGKETEALSVIRRPLERIMIRYRSIPKDLLTIVRVREDEAMEDPKLLILHNAISKYLECRRRIWSLPQLNVTSDRTTRVVAEYILSVLMQRRLQEGFRVAWTHEGIVGFCRQVIVQSGPALQQYVIFPPTKAGLKMSFDRERMPSLSETWTQLQIGRSGHSPTHSLYRKSSRIQQATALSQLSATKRLQPDETFGRVSDSRPVALIAESWSEPCAICESKVVQSPTAAGDDELVSVLFTVDQLLRMCHMPANGPITLKVSSRTLDSPHVTKTVSGCVSVVHQPFDLPKLVLRSERCLVILPAVEHALDLLLSAIHDELASCFDTCLAVEDESFWAQVAPMIRLEQDYDTELPGMVCRVYMREESPWVLSVVVVPMAAESIEVLDAIPLLFCLCDEPLLAADLGKRNSPPPERILDRRYSCSPSAKSQDEEKEIAVPSIEWVSTTRCLDVLRENYKPGCLSSVISDVDETVINKAVVSALYTAVKNGIIMDQAVVRSILDEQCECVSLEVSGLARSLNTFCSHLNVEGHRHSKTSYCGESKAQLNFSNMLRGTFKQVPGLPYFYYTPQRKESEGRFPGKCELAFFEGLFSDQTARGCDTAISDRRLSDARTAEDTISSTGSLRRNDRPVDQFRLRHALNAEKENGKFRNGDDKQSRALGYGRDYPLFIYFMCSVEYPDRSMDTFPVTFLPTCIKEVLRGGVGQADSKIDVKSIVVRLDLYVMTWPSEKVKKTHPQDDSDTDTDEDTHTQRQMRFLEKMPKKERMVIGELMNRLNRLVELEMVLMDSRKLEITEEKIKKISAYIDHEYTREKAFKTGQVETRLRRCPLVIQSPEAVNRLKARLNQMHLEYCVMRRVEGSNLYYCCQVDDVQAFERYSRQNSGSKNDGSDTSDILRKDQLFDFWVILIIDDSIKLQFCQRENGCHYRIFDLAWRKCRQTIRVVNQEMLLSRMFELRECDSLLMTDVHDSISIHDGSLDRSNTSSVSEDQEVDTHIAHGARFTFPPGYFACPLQKKLWFEIHPRLRLPRGSGRDPLAAGCDALRMSLERFSIRNRPNTYVVRESNGSVSYMQLHTSIETFNASLKRHRINVKKRKETKEVERFKTHVLLAVYGVDHPGREICEVLSDCLQKRLDQVILSQLIDTLAKNTQTRLDSADVQFLQRDPVSPAGVFNYSIPNAMSQFLQPLSYYTHQHMQAVMPSARYKEDYGSGGTCVGERSVFQPLPFSGKHPDSYVPIFYLLVKSPQEGTRSTGIAAIELRFVTGSGEMASLTTGRLNISTHLSLAPTFCNVEEREMSYREMTRTIRCEQLKEMPGVCAFAQVAVWQAGDVDLTLLEDQLRHVVQLGMCDVVTEFGILNLNVIEVGAQLPVSPGVHISPHSKSVSSAKTPTSTSERRQQLRKRDSSDALPVASTPGLPTDSSVRSKGTSVFSFETRRGSFTSELDRMSVDYVLPASNRSPDFVNPTFVSTAGPWFDYVVDEYSGNPPSYITEKGERYTSVLRHSWMFDCKQTVNKALREIVDRVLGQVRNVDAIYPDRVQIFEPSPRLGEPAPLSSTSSTSSTTATKSNRERRYEAAPLSVQYCMSADIGRDPYDCDMPDAVVICQEMQVAIETQRFGFEPVGACPETLLRLNNSVSKELFLPCTEEGHFVPRRRIMYGTVYGEKLTLYFYNFMPSLSASLMNMVARATSWYNSRARLVREIGLHKMGITYLSPLEYFQSPTDNPYLVLVWRHPDELLDKDYPPDDLQITAIDALPKGYSASLFRLYRRPDIPHLLLNRSPCLIQDQLEQMRQIRKNTREQLNMVRAFSTVHELLLSGRNKLAELDLEKLRSVSKLVHFVETPVLFFQKWRRNIAEVRQVRATVELDPRKTKIPTGPSSLAPGTRQRANTLSVPPSAPAPFRIRSDIDDDDPCQAKILYLLMGDYVAYLSSLGLQLLKVTNLERRSEERRMYTINYPQGCKHAPYVVMYKAAKGGVMLVTLSFTRPYFAFKLFIWHPTSLREAINKGDTCADSLRLIRELQQFKDIVISQCHLHSFTYDFHLRMLSRYLVGKDKMLFSPGYNTHAFLVDFLEYYGCRPPNARNCVYEERCTYALQHGVRGGDVWDHFLSCEKAYGWTVLKLKNSEERSTEQRRDDFMLVSSESTTSTDGSKELFRVVLRDRRHEREELHLLFYLIAVATDQTSPLEEERHREDSRQSEVGEFKNFEKKKEVPPVESVKDIEQMVNRINDDDADGSLSSRRRFSSGGHLQSSTTAALSINKPPNLESILNSPRCSEGFLKGAESDGDVHRVTVQGNAPRRHRKPAYNDDGTIPGEHVTYIHFLSTRQRILQKEVEDAVSQFSLQLTSCVKEAEFLCRRAIMWKQVLLPKTGRSAQQAAGLSSIFLGSNPNRSLDQWHQLRSVSHHETMEPSKLKTLISIVSQYYMESREPRLRELLEGSNCARLCRFLFARYGPDRCRFFEFPNSTEKCLIVTNPDLDAMFMIECVGETTPTLSVLLKEADLVEDTQDESKLFRQQRLDTAFDDLVACVTAFLWADLLQKPPGTH